MEPRHYQYMKKVLAILPFCLFTSLPLSAQTFTQRVQQQRVAAGGMVTIHHDAAIDELVNGKPEPLPVLRKETKTPARKQTAADKREQQLANAKREQQQTSDKREQQQQERAGEQTEQTIDSLTMEPQRTRQVMGYRIQVFAGGKTRADRQKAEQTANTLKSLFPGQKVYVHFYSPRWICRLGNFRTMEEAREMLSEVVKMGYDQATLVRGKVTVPY